MYRKSFLVILLFPVLLFGQDNFNAPPGTVKFSDSLYVDEVPVTNLMYLEFLSSIGSFWDPGMHQTIQNLPKHGVNPNFREVNQKEERESDLLSYSLPVAGKSDYLRHPRFQQHPVLQISKREAELFCRWRTDMVMLLWAIHSATPEERERYPSGIKYRLPTSDEYKQVVDHFESSGKLKKTREGSPLELAAIEPLDQLIFYNISEFTYEGSLYGSNWKGNTIAEFPNDATGFRCICEVQFQEYNNLK